MLAGGRQRGKARMMRGGEKEFSILVEFVEADGGPDRSPGEDAALVALFSHLGEGCL